MSISKEDKIICIQCGEELTYHIVGGDSILNYCENPVCPNYGLYQIGEKPLEKGKNENL